MSTLIRDLPEDQGLLFQAFLSSCENADGPEIIRLVQTGLLPSLSLQDDDGWTPLHYASTSGDPDVVKFLLDHGALWSMVDNLGHTAGDVAFSLNCNEIYQMIVNEGLRSELLRLTIEDKLRARSAELQLEDTHTQERSAASDNAVFLASKLTYKTSATGQRICVDEEGNGVMLGWESEIMKETARHLCTGQEPTESFDLAVLNIGFGLGLIDGFLQEYRPTRHVIVEAHPDVLKYMKDEGWDQKPGVVIYEGRWQSFLKEVEAGTIEANFDGVYWDTFSEDYRDLKQVFETVFGLLAGPQARFSWFHGLGATSRTLYDVYTEMAELDLREAGLKTSWYEVQVDGGQAIWEGIKRRYWDIPSSYRLPICTYDM